MHVQYNNYHTRSHSISIRSHSENSRFHGILHGNMTLKAPNVIHQQQQLSDCHIQDVMSWPLFSSLLCIATRLCVANSGAANFCARGHCGR